MPKRIGPAHRSLSLAQWPWEQLDDLVAVEGIAVALEDSRLGPDPKAFRCQRVGKKADPHVDPPGRTQYKENQRSWKIAGLLMCSSVPQESIIKNSETPLLKLFNFGLIEQSIRI